MLLKDRVRQSHVLRLSSALSVLGGAPDSLGERCPCILGHLREEAVVCLSYVDPGYEGITLSVS